MEKKLLMPTDFSNNSWNAIQYGIKLYEREVCDFYILNTYNTEAYGLKNLVALDPDTTFNSFSEKRSRRGLGDVMNRLTFENDNPNHRFHLISRPSPFVDTVKDLVLSLECDMVIMGARGLNKDCINKYGSNTMEVIRCIRECPVLVVPKEVVLNPPEEIILATDLNVNYKIAEIEHLAQIAKISNAKLKILVLTQSESLSPQQKSNQILLQRILKDFDQNFVVLQKNRVPNGILGMTEVNNNRNMISYMETKRTIWEQFGLVRPPLRRLNFLKELPVLALRG